MSYMMARGRPFSPRWTEGPVGYNGIPKTWENRPKTCFERDSCGKMSQQSSVDSYNSEQKCDVATGANPNAHMVPEFLTGRPMHSREPLQRQKSNNDESQDLSLRSLRLPT